MLKARTTNCFIIIQVSQVQNLNYNKRHCVWLVSHPFFCSLSEVAFTPFTDAKLVEYQCESVKGMLSCPFHPFTNCLVLILVDWLNLIILI